MSEEREKVEAVKTAFVNDFAQYAEMQLDGISLDDAETKLR